MKTTAFILLVTVLFCSCKKGGKDQPAPREGLIDRWEMRKAVGGIAGTVEYKPGNSNILEFQDSNTYKHSINGTVFQSGTYELQPIPGNELLYRITFHFNMGDFSQDALLKGDTLILYKYAPCCDIPDVTYVRVY